MRELGFCEILGKPDFAECLDLRATKNSAAMKNQAIA